MGLALLETRSGLLTAGDPSRLYAIDLSSVDSPPDNLRTAVRVVTSILSATAALLRFIGAGRGEIFESINNVMQSLLGLVLLGLASMWPAVLGLAVVTGVVFWTSFKPKQQSRMAKSKSKSPGTSAQSFPPKRCDILTGNTRQGNLFHFK